MKKNNRNPNRHRGGFTLLEMIIVLFIILMVAGLGVYTLNNTRKAAQLNAVLAHTKGLAGAVKTYDANVGRFPTTEQGLVVLRVCPDDMSPARWAGPYLDTDSALKDPWDNPYQYLCPGEHGDFDIWSYGPDGPSGDTIIGNWMEKIGE